MKLEEAKKLFIQEWGVLAEYWGIQRSAGELHALLLISKEPISTDEIMTLLQASRGGVNGRAQQLNHWGLIRKITKKGSRMDFYETEKDMWKVAQQIARERKRRELDPIQYLISKLHKIEGPRQEVKEFQEVIQSIEAISDIAGKALDLLSRSGLTGFLKSFR